MEYFVSIENTPYHHWQVELLIESFMMQGLENNLVIAMANNENPKIIDLTHHLKNFKRIFIHDNFNKKKNRCGSLYLAVREKLIQPPFAIIDPDMILVESLIPPKETIQFQVDFELKINETAKEQLSIILEQRNVPKPHEGYWIPLGRIICFNEINNEFLDRLIGWTTLDLEERYSWILALTQFNGIIPMATTQDYEMTLFDHNQKKNFIHYDKGMPPYFHKCMHHYDGPFSMGNVFSQILEFNPTSSTSFLQNVVKSYLNKLPKSKLTKVEPIAKVKVTDGNSTNRS